MDVDLSQAVTVRTFGFNVPCRQFIISAQVTRDKRMPMVDEFVLRVLKACEKVPSGKLAAYFGFTPSEMQTVLCDLQTRGLIVIEDNDVSLHKSAQEMFRISEGGVPNIVEVEGWVNRVWFDLVSQNMIAPQGLRHVRNLLELKPSARKQELGAEFAREAFQANFREYLRVVRKINNPEKLSLYAITDVEPKRFSFVPIASKEDLIFDPQPKLQPTLLDSDQDPPHRLRLLTDAMSVSFKELRDAEPSQVARSEFCRLAETEPLPTVGAFVDLRQWVGMEKDESVETCSFLGTSYIERNRNAFSTLLARSSAIDRLSEAESAELVWFRPGGSAWGASEDLRLMLAEIRAVLKKPGQTDRLMTSTLVIPAASKNDGPKRFERIFDRAYVTEPGWISPALEIVLIRGIAAIISVIIPLRENVHVWVGKATANNEHLQRIEKRLSWTEESKTALRLWPASSPAGSIQ
jgi:hypothetical protein